MAVTVALRSVALAVAELAVDLTVGGIVGPHGVQGPVALAAVETGLVPFLRRRRWWVKRMSGAWIGNFVTGGSLDMIRGFVPLIKNVNLLGQKTFVDCNLQQFKAFPKTKYSHRNESPTFPLTGMASAWKTAPPQRGQRDWPSLAMMRITSN